MITREIIRSSDFFTGEAFSLIEKMTSAIQAKSGKEGKTMIGLKRGTVALVPHDPQWEKEARLTIQRLKDILGNVIVAAEHVGSTSVPTIQAKPILDIMLAVEDFSALAPYEIPLREEGFYYRPHATDSIPNQLLFACGSFYQGTGDLQTHFIHVVKKDSEEQKNYLYFRDALRKNLALAKEYEALKLSLAKAAPQDSGREKYTSGKHDFILSVLQRRSH